MFTKAFLNVKVPQEAVEKLLLRDGHAVLAIEEDEKGVCFWLPGKVDCSSYPFITNQEWVSSEIDWEAQWRAFSPCFYDNLFHLDLSPWGVEHILLLKPGPGFGDLSHPTTRLMLEMMMKEQKLVKKAHVLDIGSGSGVLALTAKLMGADVSVGIDIDPAANRHARKNARMNSLTVPFLVPGRKAFSSLESAEVVLINMIFQEQTQALAQHQLIPLGAYLISSGILKKQKSSYIRWMQELSFELLETFQEGEWMGFIFRKRRLSRKGSTRL